jgi:hypothetical protein
VVKNFKQKDPKFVDLVLQGEKKSSFFLFKRYNLAIYVVNFFGTFSTRYFRSLEQDPTVKIQKNRIRFSLYNLH